MEYKSRNVPAITRSGLGTVPDPPSPAATADVETFTWERAKSSTPDCSAFFDSEYAQPREKQRNCVMSSGIEM